MIVSECDAVSDCALLVTVASTALLSNLSHIKGDLYVYSNCCKTDKKHFNCDCSVFVSDSVTNVELICVQHRVIIGVT